MKTFSPDAASVWPDGPLGAPYHPEKPLIRAWGSGVEDFVSILDDQISAQAMITGFQGGYNASVGVFPDTGTAQKGENWRVRIPGTIDGIALNEGDLLIAIVNNASQTTYAGNWIRIPVRGKAYVFAEDTGAGTANAIQVTSGDEVENGTPLIFAPFRDTTSSPITISINGASPLTIKTASGNNASALTAGMLVFGILRASDNSLRLLTDQASAALVAQAEAARDDAVAAAARDFELPWVNLQHSPTYLSAGSFKIAGNVTSDYTVGRRVRLKGTTPFTLYGTISASNYSAPDTTVTVILDGGALDSSLNQVAVGVLADGQSIPEMLSIGRLKLKSTESGQHALEIFNSGGGNGYAIRMIGDSGSEMIYMNAQGESSPGVPVNPGAITRFDSEGGMIMGNPTALAVADISPGVGYFPRLQLFGAGGSATASFVMGQFMNDGSYPTLFLTKSRAVGGWTGNAIVQNGDGLGRIAFMGDDGTDIKTLAASIAVKVNAAPGVDKIPAQMEFQTMDSTGAIAVRLTVDTTGIRTKGATLTSTSAGARTSPLSLVNADDTALTSVAINFQPSSIGSRTGSARVENTAGTNNMQFIVGLSAGGAEADKFKITSAGYMCLPDGVTAPGANMAGFAQFFIDSSDGDLKVRFSDGVVKTIVVDT